MEIMVLLLCIFLLIVGIVNFLWALIFSVPYVPSNKKFIDKCIEILERENIKTAADLGAGDGRVALAMTRIGIKVDAFEINPFLSLLIRVEKIFLAPNTLEVLNKNFEYAHFEKYQAIVVYLMPHIMERMEDKIFSQMPENSVIISNSFKFKKHNPEKVYNKLYLYRVTK